MKLTVVKKMMLLTGLVVAGLIGLGISSYIQIHKVFDSASYAAINTVPTYMQFLKIHGAANALRSDSLFHVIVTDATEMQELEKKIKEDEAMLDETIAVYAKNACTGLTCISDDKEQKMYDEMLALKEAIKIPLQRVIGLSKESKTKDAEIVIRDELVPAFEKLVNVINAELDYNIELAQIARNQAITQEKTASEISILIMLLIGMLIGVFCWLFSKSLFKELGKEPAELAELAKQFAAGDLSASIHLKSDDTNSVTYSAKTLQNTLRTLVNDTNKLNYAAMQGDLAMRADANQHQGDFRKIVRV